MSNLHLEILDTQRKNTFQKLNVFKDRYYLAGGTALALQLGHRQSVDFDIFSLKPLPNSLTKQIEKQFGEVRFLLNNSDQINFATNNNISVTFLHYWYKPLETLVKTETIPLASIKDIIADKSHTIGRRAVWRDYVDIFSVLKNNIITLENIITNAQQKFGNEFVPEQFLEQLVYYDDLEVVKIDWINKGYSSKEIKEYLENTVQDYTKTIRK